MTAVDDDHSGPADRLLRSIASRQDLAVRQRTADRLLEDEGAGHIVHDLPVRADGRSVSLQSRPWRIDPIPYTLDAADFEAIAAAITARMRMLETVIDDLYGERRLLADGIVDSAALWSSARYRLAALLPDRPRRWLTNYSIDLVQSVDGDWCVVRDSTDAPAGFGYALLDRSVTAQVHRDVLGRLGPASAPRSLDPFADHLLDALADVATTDSPRIVVMSGGVEHPSFVEQSYLATRLGLNLAEGADLVVRQRRLWLRSLAGLEPVDVLFRRLEDDRLDPMEVNAEGHSGIPGVLLAARAGGVRLANAHGCGVIEEPALAGAWDTAGEWLPNHSAPPTHAVALRTARAGEDLCRWPCFDGDTVVDRPVVLRLHAVAGDRGIQVLPGGIGRVLAEGDDPALPTAAAAKDLWVVGGRAPSLVRSRREPLPQVDLIASVPTRAAEALFWAGRALERSDLLARSLRVVLDRTGEIDADGWLASSLDMIDRIAAAGLDVADDPTAVMPGAAKALVDQLGSLLAEVSSVREFFSATSGRVLARLAEARSAIGTDVAADPPSVDITSIDGVLIDIASMAGMWNESVLHGPAWRFGEIGRRLERVFGLIDAVQGAFRTPIAASEEPFATRHLIEVLLATNESLVAYRRRYRSDVDLPTALHLLLASERNPRAAAASLNVLAEQADELAWTDGAAAARSLVARIDGADLTSRTAIEELLSDMWSTSDTLARELVSSRLASPVDPRMMGSS